MQMALTEWLLSSRDKYSQPVPPTPHLRGTANDSPDSCKTGRRRARFPGYFSAPEHLSPTVRRTKPLPVNEKQHKHFIPKTFIAICRLLFPSENESDFPWD